MTDVLSVALAKHLCLLDQCSSVPCADHLSTAGAAMKWLANAGAILPPGITIGAVYEVFRNGTRDGYCFTDRREADEQARYGGQDGRSGEVRTAWRIRGDGVDETTTWRRVDG